LRDTSAPAEDSPDDAREPPAPAEAETDQETPVPDPPSPGEERQEGTPDTADGGRVRSRPAWLTSGSRFFLGTVVAAIIGFLVPIIAAWASADDDGPPITVSIYRDPKVTNDDSMVFKEVISDRSKLPNRDREPLRENPLLTKTGYDALVQGATIAIKAQDESVAIVGMRAHIVTSRPPIAGTFLDGRPQGVENYVRLGFDLDSADRSAHAIVEGGLGPLFFEDDYLRLDPGEQQILQVLAFTENATYSWGIEIEVVVDNEKKTLYFEPDGGPLVVTGCSRTYGAFYTYPENPSDHWQLHDVDC